jgi:toxin FitB
MKYLLDTNVFSEIGRTGRHSNVTAWLAAIDDLDLAISALTVREISKGIAKLMISKPDVAARVAERTDAIFNDFAERILPIDRAVARAWGYSLAESGRHIDDSGFAATARVHGLVLVTRNVRDFSGREVSILNPFKSPPERAFSPSRR